MNKAEQGLSQWEEKDCIPENTHTTFQNGADNDEDDPSQISAEKILYLVGTGMSLFALVIVIVSSLGLAVIDEWEYVTWTRKLSNSLGIVLWGLYFTTLVVFNHQRQRRQRNQDPTDVAGSLAFLRNTSWFVLVLSILTGIILALGSIASCGKGWTFYFFFYHICGFLGVICSLMMWFVLPNAIRTRLAGTGIQHVASCRHLRPIRKWIAVLTVTVTLVLPWMITWLVLWGYSRGSVNESLYPDSATSSYLLPFENGNTFFVSQGNGGAFSHSDEAGYYAYDFMVACGTPIVASRGGTVDLVIDSNNGNHLSGQSSNNLVYISHGDDGTTARYLHIQQGGALVKEGDEVVQGQTIARSGNVGYSTGPHLHFAVSKLEDFKSVTTPISFQDVTKDKGIPRAFRTYESGNGT